MNVYIFGAGASAAEGAPAMGNFFARSWQLLGPQFDDQVARLWRFLAETFHLEIHGPESFAFIPTIDEVVSLVDWSLHVDQGLGDYDPPRLYQVGRDLEHLLCATLDAALAERRPDGPHARFVQRLKAAGSDQAALLSLNYDTLLDDTLEASGVAPNYGFRDLDWRPADSPLLAKLHGSTNWGRCHACDHITVVRRQGAQLLSQMQRLRCARCGGDRVHAVIVTPTWLKRYHAAQLRHVWDLALEALQRAERILFVGYSMPPADVALHHLLRRALLTHRCTARPQVGVINHHPPGIGKEERRLREEGVRQRFSCLFGPEVQFDFSGFSGQN